MNVQPARDCCTALCIVCVMVAFWFAYRGGTIATPAGWLELALVCSILAETYAKDE